ncbi:hypothetical protein PG326_08770 [Riemerella anatipestifer]|nr:hypothetical protein [Riemerella anatipestifer]MDY3358412.1 hypothetical protein [Riemerella anatipestifer]
MKKTLLCAVFLPLVLNAQDYNGRVGINTNEPKATLEISKEGNSKSKGLIIPRLTASEVKTMTDNGNVGENQNSMMVYITEGFATPDTDKVGKYELIDASGYYYYDHNTTTLENSRWRKVGNGVYTAGKGMKLNNTEFSRTGLEEVTENGKTGWRFIGRNPDYYGNIGVGAVDSSYSNYANDLNGALGYMSFAQGIYARSWGYASIAMGSSAQASNDYRTAIGPNAEASGESSMALGTNAKASGGKSLAIGGFASGDYSLAISGNSEDYPSVRSVMNSIATGKYSIAISNAPGYSKSVASGEWATLIGSGIASGYGSLVLASNIYSSALASGPYSVVIGKGTASGNGSFAVGGTASGLSSFALGYDTVADSSYSTAMGKSNTIEKEPDTELYRYSLNKNRLLVIGNGASLLGRSDAFTILRNAKVGIDINNFETTLSDAKLQVNGAIKISNNPATATNGVYNTSGTMPCNESNYGSIKFENDNFYGCKSTGWVLLNN